MITTVKLLLFHQKKKVNSGLSWWNFL